MNGDDENERGVAAACADCGALLDVEGARLFEFGEQGTLCWSCAVRRGGSYDANEERWTTPPRVSDLRARLRE